MEKKSIRAIVKEPGVSYSYLPKVVNGERHASDKVVNILPASGLLTSESLHYN